MDFAEFIRLSPNCDPSVRHEQRGVLFHHSVIPFEETIALMVDHARKVSYHCLIAPDGTRCTLVPDDQIAWHAGASHFQGRSGCNAFLLGLSFAGDSYASPLGQAQLASAVEWLAPRWSKHSWSIAWMTDHRQVAPGRKDDLNPSEWGRLRAALVRQFGER